MRKNQIKDWLTNYNNVNGEDEAVHEFVKLQIASRLGKSALKVFDNLAYSNTVKGQKKFFLPYGKVEEFADTYSR